MTKELFGSDIVAPVEASDQVDFVAEATKKFHKEDGTLDVEALAKGKFLADRTISEREVEQAALREDLKTRVTMETFLARIESQKKSDPSNQDEPNPDERNDQPQSNKDEIHDTNRIKKLIQETLNQETQKSHQSRNVERVAQELQRQWGPDYQAKLQAKTKELGKDKVYMTTLAANDPEIFLKLVDAKASQPQQPSYVPPKSTVRVDNSGKPGEMTKMSQFEKLRKENPNAYFNPKIQNKMMDLTREHGKDFLDS